MRFCCFIVFVTVKTLHAHAEQVLPPDRAARTESIMGNMISSAKTTWTRVFFYLVLFSAAGLLSSLISGALLPVEFMQSVQAAQTTQTAQTAQEVFPGEYQYPDEYLEEHPGEYPGGDSGRITVLDYGNARMEGDAVLVLGHTGCGAVEAAIHHDPSGFIKYITDEIQLAIGDETDSYRASCLNVEHSIKQISHALDIDHLRHGNDPAVVGAIYHIDDGHVEFL